MKRFRLRWILTCLPYVFVALVVKSCALDPRVPVELGDSGYRIATLRIDGHRLDPNDEHLIGTGWHRFEAVLEDGTIRTHTEFIIIDWLSLYVTVEASTSGKLLIRDG